MAWTHMPPAAAVVVVPEEVMAVMAGQEATMLQVVGEPAEQLRGRTE